jgi:hypothetical protein
MHGRCHYSAVIGHYSPAARALSGQALWWAVCEAFFPLLQDDVKAVHAVLQL